ncbi:hypothetical protein Q8A73_008588 [Channa argus]|nr:hypothetical protein Q8A73_008588 [Channa argus]
MGPCLNNPPVCALSRGLSSLRTLTWGDISKTRSYVREQPLRGPSAAHTELVARGLRTCGLLAFQRTRDKHFTASGGGNLATGGWRHGADCRRLCGSAAVSQAEMNASDTRGKASLPHGAR